MRFLKSSKEAGGFPLQEGACEPGPTTSRIHNNNPDGFPFIKAIGQSAEDEAALVRRAQAGDRAASERLLRACEPGLFNYLHRMLNHFQDSEDALQETYIRALRGLSAYREQGQFKAWLYRIAYREALRVIRRRGSMRVESTAALDEALTDPGPAPSALLEQTDEARRIEAQVARLPRAEREVFHLRVQSGLSFREIAEVTHTPINTALGRMRNAILKLRNAVGKEERG